MNALYQGAVNNRHSIGSLERIFEAGLPRVRQAAQQRPAHPDASDMVDGARRAMRATFQREMDFLERHLAFLASTGSVSPYVGLFGTVWGIMHAFRSLANVQQATLAQVAPGIAEALVATAIGLFAAIPAVVAYNRYSHDIDRLANALRELHGGVLEHPASTGREIGDASGARRRGPMHEINIVPYVDVMLVLLVIFMVTAPLVTPAIIDLPTVDKASAPRVVPLEVFVKADQALVVRQRDTRGSVVERAVAQSRPAFAGSSRGRRTKATCGADRRRQERALRGGAAGDGRAAQAGRAEGRPAGQDAEKRREHPDVACSSSASTAWAARSRCRRWCTRPVPRCCSSACAGRCIRPTRGSKSTWSIASAAARAGGRGAQARAAEPVEPKVEPPNRRCRSPTSCWRRSQEPQNKARHAAKDEGRRRTKEADAEEAAERWSRSARSTDSVRTRSGERASRTGVARARPRAAARPVRRPSYAQDQDQDTGNVVLPPDIKEIRRRSSTWRSCRPAR